MTIVTLDDGDMESLLRSPSAASELATAHGVDAVVVDGGIDQPDLSRMLAELPTVTIALGAGALSQHCDVVAVSTADDDDDGDDGDDEDDDGDDGDAFVPLGELTRAIERNPLASFALVSLLRGAGQLSIVNGLAAESATYSMLQAGPEFARWRAANPPRSHTHDPARRVLVERDDATLHIALNRPERHNAFDVAMRDELFEALLFAVSDESLRTVRITGQGASFCSGGDLDSFGTSPDPAAAHAVRLGRSCGRLLSELSQRAEVQLHGACFGAGIELPAFCARVTAAADTVIALPEIALGLIPGAGGTVSLTRRIGRQRTAYLALTGARIGAVTARTWGLVD
jgi:hypothetical protein